jgi:hypothetical protein
MDHGLRRRCLSTRDGQDMLKVLALEAFTQEMAITDMSATSRIGEPQDRKIRQSRMPNRTIRFPRERQQFLVIGMSRKH